MRMQLNRRRSSATPGRIPSLLRLLCATVIALAALPAVADGAELYASYCQTCHGAEGKGDGAGIPDGVLKPRPFSAAVYKFDTDADWEKGTDADLSNVIRNGTRAYGGSPLMPPWPSLSDAEVAELVAHVRTLQAR